MQKKIKTTSNLVNLNDREWLDFVRASPEATIFHLPAWVELITKCYGYQSFGMVVRGANGEITAGLPLVSVNSMLTGSRIVSLPFSDYCQPLSSDAASLEALLQELLIFGRENGNLKIHVRWPLPENTRIYSDETNYLHLTHLENDPDVVFHRFNKSQVQRHIRQAEKLGVKIRFGETQKDIDLFYGLHLKTRHRQGVPIQPRRFFRLIWEHLISQGMGFILLAYQGDQLLAGALFLHYNKSLTYKFGASDSNYWKLRPNDALFWYAIRWGCNNGYSIFDWGKTSMDTEGLRDFKRGWGSEEKIIHYSVISDYPPTTKLSSGHTQNILEKVIQHSPEWVCRVIGELLYGHFA